MSGIGLTAKLVESATKVAVTRNKYNDTVYGATTTSACLYRDISSLVQRTNQVGTEIDGLLWFDANESVSRGDIYYHASEGYLKIERITKAKRLVADNALKFIKCEVTKQRQLS
jgi:hypothetical protein